MKKLILISLLAFSTQANALDYKITMSECPGGSQYTLYDDLKLIDSSTTPEITVDVNALSESSNIYVTCTVGNVESLPGAPQPVLQIGITGGQIILNVN